MTHPRVTLDQWRTLAAVVDHGGFAQAAEHLHRSQSSVSYTVAKLQEQLGMQLLVMEGRRAQLTRTGTLLLNRGRQLVEEALRLERLAHSVGSGWEPVVRLVVDAAFPGDLLMAALKAFEPLSRGSRVQLNEVVLSGADEALVEGEANLVIGSTLPPGFLGDTLVQIEFVAVAHPQHTLHRLGRALTQADLKRELHVVIRDSGHRQPRDSGWLGGEQRWTVTHLDTAVAAVRSGLGFGWLPLHQVRHLLEEGTLVPLPLREGGRYRSQLYLIPGQPEAPGPATLELARCLRETCAGAVLSSGVAGSPLPASRDSPA